MNPVGIAIAFVLFWALIGMGLFLTTTGIVGLAKKGTGIGYAARAEVATKQATGLMIYMIVLLAGLAMTYAGAYATYAVIYR